MLTSSQTLTFKLVSKVDDSLKPDVIKWSAFYEHRITQGSVRTDILMGMDRDANRPNRK